MNKPHSSSQTLYGIAIALLMVTAFLFLSVYFLLIFIPVITFLIWTMYNRVKTLEKRFEEPNRSQT